MATTGWGGGLRRRCEMGAGAFDPKAWMRRLPALDLFGALVFQVIGQQISVVAATAIFGRLAERFGGRAPDPEGLAALGPETLRELGEVTVAAHVAPKLKLIVGVNETAWRAAVLGADASDTGDNDLAIAVAQTDVKGDRFRSSGVARGSLPIGPTSLLHLS